MSASVAAKGLARDQDAAIAPAVETPSTRRELRVLQVFSVLSVGGAETWLMALLKYFNESAHGLPVKVKCDILLTGGEPSVFDEEAKALGARLFYVLFTRKNPLRFVTEFRRILAAGQYDVVHDHQDYIAGLHFLMGLGHLPPIRIAHVHNHFYERAKYAKGLVRRVVRPAGHHLLGRLATHVMGTSRQVVSEYGFDGFKSRGVALGAAYCGFDVSSYQGNREQIHTDLCREFGWEPSAKVILFVGRLEADAVFPLGPITSDKNPGFALEVAKECLRRDSEVRLLMVGAGNKKRRELESQIREWGLEERIKLAGIRTDVPRLMLGSNLLLFPSLAEGLGMVVVEAQAAGLPVLASDATPRECVVVPELVEFLPLTDPNNWARQTLQLLSRPRPNPSECNAAVRRSPFSIENSAMSLAAIYCERENA